MTDQASWYLPGACTLTHVYHTNGTRSKVEPEIVLPHGGRILTEQTMHVYDHEGNKVATYRMRPGGDFVMCSVATAEPHQT